MRIETIGFPVFFLAFSARQWRTLKYLLRQAHRRFPLQPNNPRLLRCVHKRKHKTGHFHRKLPEHRLDQLKSLTGENPPTPSNISAPRLSKQANFGNSAFQRIMLKVSRLGGRAADVDAHAGKMELAAHGQGDKPKFSNAGLLGICIRRTD